MFEEQNHSTWALSSTPKDTNTNTDTDTDTDTQDILILIDVYEVQFNDTSSCVATSMSVPIQVRLKKSLKEALGAAGV